MPNTAPPRTLSLDYLTVAGPGAPDAAELISIGAAVGCKYVSLSMSGNTAAGIPAVADHPQLLREALARSAATGVSTYLVSGFSIKPDVEAESFRRKLEAGAQLGAKGVLALILEEDKSRAADQFAKTCVLGRELGLDIMIEFFPLSAVKTVQAAIEMCTRSGQSNARILVDSLHLRRGGGSPADLAKVPRGMIGYAQICDGPLASAGDEAYWDEAVNERAIPGEGELPLIDFVNALPKDVVIGAEVPLKSLYDRGIGPLERAKRVMDGTRKLIERAQAAN